MIDDGVTTRSVLAETRSTRLHQVPDQQQSLAARTAIPRC
jgi:hypothetical protein